MDSDIEEYRRLYMFLSVAKTVDETYIKSLNDYGVGENLYI